LTNPISSILVFDLDSRKAICAVPLPVDGRNAISASLHRDTKHITQLNSDGSVHIYDCKTGKELLHGAYLDQELVLMDQFGYFDDFGAAADYIQVRIPGLPGRHLLSQFSRNLRRPGIVREVMGGGGPSMPAEIHVPPLPELKNNQLDVFSSFGLDYVQYYADGRPVDKSPLKGTLATTTIPKFQAGAGLISAFAVGMAGIVSAPLVIANESTSLRKGTLYALAVGVDHYPWLPAQCGISSREACDLKFSAADANRIVNAVRRSQRYANTDATVLVNERADRGAILAILDRIISQAGKDDTILISFAGHGLYNHAKLLLGLSTTLAEDIPVERTSLSFEVVAERLRKAKAKVILFLDVCHAGLAEQATVATNEDAVANLVTDNGTSMIIFSASKGKQCSEEAVASGGGRFSVASEQIITNQRQSYDLDKNGFVSIEELYRGLKSKIVRDSAGRQVPVLSRNLLVGDFDLF
jgi:uncharacterized caspase-like protein